MTRSLHRGAWVVPVSAPPIFDGAVLVHGSSIESVGPATVLQAANPGVEVVDHGRAVLLPGLVACHTHLEYASYGGFGDGLGFGEWLADHLHRKRGLDPAAMLAGATLGAFACVRTGVTAIGDCSFSGDALTAAAAAGLRGIVYLEAFGTGDPGLVVADLERRLDGSVADARLAVGVSPHAPYSVSPDVYRALVAEARRRGLRTATHVAESRDELDALVRGEGPIAAAVARMGGEVPRLGEHPLRRLHREGCLGPDVAVIHAVELGQEEMVILAETASPVAHCPRSNAQLGCGAAPVRALLDAGVVVGLGMDSPASALSFDMFEELRCAIWLARSRERSATALSPAEALEMATLGSAAVLGLGDRCGSLEAGKAADLTALDLGASAFWPVEDPVAAIVYDGSPERVTMTMIDGVVRYGESESARYAAALASASPGRAAMIERATTLT